ncbi:MAG: hypothetical protein IH968_06795 [Gemmatimonadetes bacterium]|nr:hypothetical protein [Gemmatimonadota bacterium]
MISSLTALLIVFAAVIGSTAMIGVFAYFFHRIRQIEARTTGEAGSYQLADQVDAMQEELLTVQEEVSRLSERLDFTEKLLMSGDDAVASGSSE